MTTILTRKLGNPLSTGRQMNDIPAELNSHLSDRELQLLVLEIQASTDRRDRVVRKQIDRLLREIPIRLNQHQQYLIGKWSGIANVESIVAEAVNITKLEAIKKIDRYDPSKSAFKTWINLILGSRFEDLKRKYRSRDESISIEDPTSKAEAKIQKKTDNDNAVIDELETAYMAEELLKFVNRDPDGHLSNTHIRGNPAATFKAILLLRIEGLTWQGIADRLNIPRHSTVSGFHDTQLRKLGSYFRKHLCRYLRG
jgi:DNA-directed RNA polymerase specialized sigma24 family protein